MRNEEELLEYESMKKIITITFILLIVIIILIGCDSSTNEPSKKQNLKVQDVGSKQDIDNKDDTTIKFIKVKSFVHLSEFEEIGTTETTHNITQLKINKSVIFNLNGKIVNLELMNFKSNDPNYEHKLYNKDKTQNWIVNDWAKIKVNNDKVDTFPDEEMVKIEFDNNDVIFLAAAMISDDNVLIFIADKLK